VGLERRVLLQCSWRRGSKGSRGQGFKGLFSKDFIRAFNILSISAILEGIETNDLIICEVRPYLSSFGNFAGILYLNRVRMTFARLATLCNALALGVYGCALRLEKIHFVSRTLESLTPCTLYDNACSIGDNPFSPQLTTTNREMIRKEI